MNKINDMDIMMIEDEKEFGVFVVQRNNMEEFTIKKDNRGLFTGNDEEVAEYLNEVLGK